LPLTFGQPARDEPNGLAFDDPQHGSWPCRCSACPLLGDHLPRALKGRGIGTILIGLKRIECDEQSDGQREHSMGFHGISPWISKGVVHYLPPPLEISRFLDTRTRRICGRGSTLPDSSMEWAASWMSPSVKPSRVTCHSAKLGAVDSATWPL